VTWEPAVKAKLEEDVGLSSSRVVNSYRKSMLASVIGNWRTSNRHQPGSWVRVVKNSREINIAAQCRWLKLSEDWRQRLVRTPVASVACLLSKPICT